MVTHAPALPTPDLTKRYFYVSIHNAPDEPAASRWWERLKGRERDKPADASAREPIHGWVG